MKTKLFRCVHIAAYLFSAFILGCSAFSYYRYVVFRRTDGGTITILHCAGGELYLGQLSFDHTWLFHVLPDPLSIQKPAKIASTFQLVPPGSIRIFPGSLFAGTSVDNV